MKLCFFVLTLAAISTSQTIGAEPTNYEQYGIELINRARANPNTEVSLASTAYTTQPGYWGSYINFNAWSNFNGAASLNEGPPGLGGQPYEISASAKQPLAPNSLIQNAADSYVEVLQANNGISHTYGGTTSDGRITSAGYDSDFPFEASQNISGFYYGPGPENLAYVSTSQSWSATGYPGDVFKETVARLHHELFVDRNVTNRGHRMTMMAPDWQEIGFALSFGTDGAFSSAYSVENYGYQTTRGPFITGVAYNDSDSDNFYTPGEAIAGLSVTVLQNGTVVGTTTTATAGGYAIAVPSNGTYSVRFTGDGVDETKPNISVTTRNVKVDAIDPGFTAQPFRITSINLSGNDVILNWTPQPGASFQVQTSINAKDWTEIPGSQTEETTYHHINGALDGIRFYQIKQIP